MREEARAALRLWRGSRANLRLSINTLGRDDMTQLTDVSNAATGALPWYKSLTGNQWRMLIAANLGWLFDGYETYALILTVGPAMHSLLEPAQYPQIAAYAGTVISITLLG